MLNKYNEEAEEEQEEEKEKKPWRVVTERDSSSAQ